MLVVHEDNVSFGVGAEVAATVAQEAFYDLDAPVRRLAMPDVPAMPFEIGLERALSITTADIAARPAPCWRSAATGGAMMRAWPPARRMDVETNLSCRTCGTPVCADCAVRTAMGVACAEHSGSAKKEAVTAMAPRAERRSRRQRLLIGGAVLALLIAGVVFLRPSGGGDGDGGHALGGVDTRCRPPAWRPAPAWPSSRPGGA